MMNKWIGVGRLVKAPNYRFKPETGTQSCDFTLAINRKLKTENKTDYINVVCFGKLAEVCNSYLDKGRRVGVEGSISTGSYIDKDGRKVYTWNVIADQVEFLWSDEKPRDQKPQRQHSQGEFGFEEIDGDLPF